MSSNRSTAGDRGARVELLFTLISLALLGAASALEFAIAQDGYWSYEGLITHVKLPAIAVLIVIFLLAKMRGWRSLGGALQTGFWVGAVSTVGLEVIRIIGFRVFHSMPGDLPTLMGVILSGRIMQGPDALSTFLGYADHFWNGAVFGMMYTLLVGRRRWWAGILYALVVGTGFLASPVVVAMGAGHFGSIMGPKFAITVYLAHILYGSLLGSLVWRWGRGRSLWGQVRGLLTGRGDTVRPVAGG